MSKKAAVVPTDPLAGLSVKHREEAEALKAKVEARARRAKVTMARTDDCSKPRLILGDREQAGSDLLHSVRAFDSLGTSSNEFLSYALENIARACRVTDDDDRNAKAISSAMALVGAIGPTDELEATMAIQMAAANELALYAMANARSAQWIDQAKAMANIGTKAMRAFALHAEALAKLRRGGEQIVKHVHVNDGGQAVIAGTVNTGGRG